MLSLAARAVHKLNLTVAQAAMDADALKLPPLGREYSQGWVVAAALALGCALLAVLFHALRAYVDKGGVLPLSSRCVGVRGRIAPCEQQRPPALGQPRRR